VEAGVVPSCLDEEGFLDPDLSVAHRRLGIASSFATAALGVAYLTCLVIGLASLPSPDDPIPDPWFSALEVLILLMMPCMVLLMVAVHAWMAPGNKGLGLAAVVFMGAVATTTSVVHFAILTLSRHESFQEMPWLFAFRWPSIAYALDILAWDVFFPLSVLLIAPAFGRNRLEAAIRVLLSASGVLALAGLAGVFLGDMRIRNIGIVGYAVLFPVAAALIGVTFRRVVPHGPDPG
jgi:hypothetical protein